MSCVNTDEMSEAEIAELLAGYGRYAEEMEAAGVLRGGSEVAPAREATTVRVRDGRVACSEGPFAQTKEQLAGYFLIECDNLDEAVKWAARCPSAVHGSIELRPLVHND